MRRGEERLIYPLAQGNLAGMKSSYIITALLLLPILSFGQTSISYKLVSWDNPMVYTNATDPIAPLNDPCFTLGMLSGPGQLGQRYFRFEAMASVYAGKAFEVIPRAGFSQPLEGGAMGLIGCRTYLASSPQKMHLSTSFFVGVRSIHFTETTTIYYQSGKSSTSTHRNTQTETTFRSTLNFGTSYKNWLVEPFLGWQFGYHVGEPNILSDEPIELSLSFSIQYGVRVGLPFRTVGR